MKPQYLSCNSIIFKLDKFEIENMQIKQKFHKTVLFFSIYLTRDRSSHYPLYIFMKQSYTTNILIRKKILQMIGCKLILSLSYCFRFKKLFKTPRLKVKI